MNEADEGLSRRQTFFDFLPNYLRLDRFDERLNDRQRDVCFQQRHAHLTQRVGDIVFGESPATAQVLDHALQALSQLVEHASIIR